METSIFIARLFCVLYLAVGTGMLLNRTFYHKVIEEFRKSDESIYLGGSLALVAGFLMVYFHNRWTIGWELAITVLGGLALIKGISLLIFPWQVMNLAGSGKWMKVWAMFALGLGAYFGYFGFIQATAG